MTRTLTPGQIRVGQVVEWDGSDGHGGTVSHRHRVTPDDIDVVRFNAEQRSYRLVEDAPTEPRPEHVVKAEAWRIAAARIRATRKTVESEDYAASLDQWADELDPPAPPTEPTALGAVVRDNSGEHWVRINDKDFPWSGPGDTNTNWYSFTKIHGPVAVVHEGWTHDR